MATKILAFANKILYLGINGELLKKLMLGPAQDKVFVENLSCGRENSCAKSELLFSGLS